ncbi:hypothetical protein [Shewanella colwelliana]|uniref:hypothetical protein n=1 Tax=Shewanella colwelliana TaxID=23 RepID=UPI0022AF986E|nr:hypothetical protein [Shewanella colwelliana]MCZ4337792.1 hypothetical protein [Shewanella colwelliana]
MVAESLKVSLENDAALMHLFSVKIIGRAIAIAVKDEEIASKEDIALLVKQLVAASVTVFKNLTVEGERFDDRLFVAVADIVYETYAKTGVIEPETLFELMPTLNMIQAPLSNEIDSIAVKLTSAHLSDVQDAGAIRLEIGLAIAKVIPFLSSFFGEFLNEKSQITAAMDCIIQGMSFVVGQADSVKFSQDYILGIFRQLTDLYQATASEYIQRTGCDALKADDVKSVKSEFAKNVGLLALSIQYCTPFFAELIQSGTDDA